jgi:hypothetical protein
MAAVSKPATAGADQRPVGRQARTAVAIPGARLSRLDVRRASRCVVRRRRRSGNSPTRGLLGRRLLFREVKRGPTTATLIRRGQHGVVWAARAAGPCGRRLDRHVLRRLSPGTRPRLASCDHASRVSRSERDQLATPGLCRPANASRRPRLRRGDLSSPVTEELGRGGDRCQVAVTWDLHSLRSAAPLAEKADGEGTAQQCALTDGIPFAHTRSAQSG